MLQAVETHTTNPAPANPQAGFLIHLIEVRSLTFGTYIAERCAKEQLRVQTISDIASGQVSDANRVIALDIAAGRCWDVSADIALEVLRQCEDHGYICREALDFCERHLDWRQIKAAWVLAKVA